MRFDPGIGIWAEYDPLGFHYDPDCFGPIPENRYLRDVRKSLLDPECEGPEILYSIVMDVGKKKDREVLERGHLLFGAVTFAAGRLGREPVRSQGHVHQISPFSHTSTPELYEIWSGRAVIYMQEFVEDDPGRCYAVEALPGDLVLVPPGWGHCTISADSSCPLTFGAWCDREYGFEYAGVRAHGGLAYFPVLEESGRMEFERNPHYKSPVLVRKAPRPYLEFGLEPGKSIYRQFEEEPGRFDFIPVPAGKKRLWVDFEP